MSLSLAPPALTTSSPWTLVSTYLDRTSPYVCPHSVQTLKAAGLLPVVTGLTGTRPERKAQAYARLLALGKVYGEEQIDEIAHVQQQIRQLQQQMSTLEPSDLIALRAATERLQEAVARALEFFRE